MRTTLGRVSGFSGNRAVIAYVGVEMVLSQIPDGCSGKSPGKLTKPHSLVVSITSRKLRPLAIFGYGPLPAAFNELLHGKS